MADNEDSLGWEVTVGTEDYYFEGYQELVDWLDSERDLLLDIASFQLSLELKQYGFLEQTIEVLKDSIGLARELERARFVSNDRQRSLWIKVSNYLDITRSSLNIVERKGRLTIVARALKDDDAATAADALATFLTNDPLSEFNVQVSASTETTSDGSSKGASYETSISNLREELDKLSNEYLNVGKLVEQQSREHNRFLATADEKISNVDHKLVEVQNAREALQDKIALDEAATFWNGKEGKSKQHNKRFRWILLALAAWIVGNAYVLKDSIEDYKEQVKYAQDIYDLVPYLPGGVILIAFAVWGARVLVRLLLSENHLATRAEEKGILIHTYLAMVNEGLAKPEDRALILSSIFSHSQDGLVQEDSMPIPGLLNMLTNTEHPVAKAE